MVQPLFENNSNDPQYTNVSLKEISQKASDLEIGIRDTNRYLFILPKFKPKILEGLLPEFSQYLIDMGNLKSGESYYLFDIPENSNDISKTKEKFIELLREKNSGNIHYQYKNNSRKTLNIIGSNYVLKQLKEISDLRN